MSEIYTVIVGILGILAISGLFVGVTNDAVNFPVSYTHLTLPTKA